MEMKLYRNKIPKRKNNNNNNNTRMHKQNESNPNKNIVQPKQQKSLILIQLYK